MRLWALLAALLLGTMVLAGCSDDDGGDGDGTSSSTSASRTSTPTSTGTGTSTTSGTTTTEPPVPPPGEPDNAAPVGSLVAAPAFNVTFGINFTLNGTDPDGDNIVWDLLYGDGNSTSGALLPANATHKYARVGSYNVTFTITDGRLQASYNVTINVTAGKLPPLTIEGGSSGIDPTASGLPMIGGCLLASSPEPTGGGSHTLDTVIDGWAWTLTAGYRVWFNDAEDSSLGNGAGSGAVPAGTASLVICTADPAKAPGGTYTFTATAP